MNLFRIPLSFGPLAKPVGSVESVRSAWKKPWDNPEGFLIGRSIVPNRSELEATVAGGRSSRKPQDAAASASDGTIGDNSSTLEGVLVDRLSPIDRSLKPPSPVRQTDENRKTPPLAHRTELLGTIVLHSKAVNQTGENPGMRFSLVRVTSIALRYAQRAVRVPLGRAKHTNRPVRLSRRLDKSDPDGHAFLLQVEKTSPNRS